MTLPILMSVPHAGLTIPPEVRDLCALIPDHILADSDEHAAEIYDLKSHVEAFITTDIARAAVDLNREKDDFRTDGVVKTHTCWNVPIYRKPLSPGQIQLLLDTYYHPYHRQLSEEAKNENVRLGLDCHTMAAFGPPVGPDPGQKRPWICLSNDDRTCPASWLKKLAKCLAKTFDHQVSINTPFRGGYIIRSHADELPWIQIEMSRDPFYPNEEKRVRILEAINMFCRMI